MPICKDLKIHLIIHYAWVFYLTHGIKMFKSKVPDIFGDNIQFFVHSMHNQFFLQYNTINRYFVKHETRI